jgi:hypothetical protein
MGFRSFCKALYRGNYDFGRRVSGMITGDMSYKKARAVGTLIDVGGAAALTYFTVPPIIGGILAASTAIAGAAALPALIPAALGTVATAALTVGLGSLTVPLIAGLFSSAMNNLHVPTPRAAAANARHAVHQTAQAVAKPFKWAGNKLSHAFKKAHDHKAKAPKFSPPKPKSFDL